MQGTSVPFRMDMSGKNFRVAPAGQRTNTEGKQVSNGVLLATPDNEYELMRPDLTYIDLPHHLSLHEPTQKIAGDGFRMMGNALERILRSAPQLQTILSRHTGLQGMQVAQTAACNRLHDIQQRLSRWLLMTQDRVNLGVLPITHDFIATMMGTDRSTVSLAAAVLQKKGIIDYVRGAVKVVNRRKLEKSACECYGVIHQFEDDLGLR